MAPRNRIIIDTDPGVDDILSMLLAFSAKPEELEVLLLSVTFGNVDVQSCLRNVVSLFIHIEKEQEWRRSVGKSEGFTTLKAHKPLVALGAEEPLADQMMMADYFHGIDGLGGIHHSHPHLTPEDTWKDLFKSALKSPDPDEAAAAREMSGSHSSFTPSRLPAHEEMLRLLRENEPDTITIVAIGPLTNLARAAATDTETFLRAKEVVVMGGAISVPGNMNPVAEFNTYADSIASARVFALTSPNPVSTMPPVPPGARGGVESTAHAPFLGPYPEKLSQRLKLTLFPLDVTTPHQLIRGHFESVAKPLLESGSPLAEWTIAFLSATFDKIESLHTTRNSGADVGLEMHDPLCIWYVLDPDSPHWKPTATSPEDIRVETSGQWTRGMCVTDRRDRRRRVVAEGDLAEVPGDTGNWLNDFAGNRIVRMEGTPGVDVFGGVLLERVFGA
ncbi:nucleoside hydrolase [Aulographum hederae CBS 113979]|uniref:Nucleoside hydrolase n=1 Tax=Aulographum hederae CBS 113979 TaxID=1176131 RepID=A0A6G1H800_9PEZI|nr:nucleoside hydrolase [Aulographum hederae CBS 113979]